MIQKKRTELMRNKALIQRAKKRKKIVPKKDDDARIAMKDQLFRIQAFTVHPRIRRLSSNKSDSLKVNRRKKTKDISFVFESDGYSQKVSITNEEMQQYFKEAFESLKK